VGPFYTLPSMSQIKNFRTRERPGTGFVTALTATIHEVVYHVPNRGDCSCLSHPNPTLEIVFFPVAGVGTSLGHLSI